MHRRSGNAGAQGSSTTQPAAARVARVLTVSDSVAQGLTDDASGPALVSNLERAGYTVDRHLVVSDDVDAVVASLRQLTGGFCGLVVTTGGTGFSPRDRTPEATRSVIDREAPGLAEATRAVNPLGRLSRGVAGVADRALVLNLPGSPRGALESLDAVLDVLPHALDLLAGGHPHPARPASERGTTPP